ncbi:MAG: FAD-dependent oxidoreductase, partial [Clostridia bacterium]|nr:FAD-dependent oxidoreductase [Clostridia bacterium]
EAELLLVAIGRVPYIKGLNLEMAGINYDRHGIKVNDQLMTNKDDIYAVGDVIGGSMLAHVASAQAIAVVERIMGLEPAINLEVWPDCTFMSPQVASAGMTEEDCISRGIAYKTGKFSFSANGKALSMGETEGFVKVIASEADEKILGMHILGPNASDLIHEAAVAISNGLTVHEVTSTIHAHPTLAEAIHEAMHSVNGEALHAAPPK